MFDNTVNGHAIQVLALTKNYSFVGCWRRLTASQVDRTSAIMSQRNVYRNFVRATMAAVHVTGTPVLQSRLQMEADVFQNNSWQSDSALR